ncbi:MAG: hypothetical protein JSS79_10225 [Bacteroidetes bacterium]|nr:hypothetical protein [Bacteroidota bacterium]
MKSKTLGIPRESSRLIQNVRNALLSEAANLEKFYRTDLRPQTKQAPELSYTEAIVKAMFEEYAVSIDDPIENYLRTFKQTISKAKTLREIRQCLEKDLPYNFLHDTDSYRTVSTKVRTWNIEIVNSCLLSEFSSCSEDIWDEMFRLNTFCTWIQFIAECEGKLHAQKDRISFQLRLYRWLKKKKDFNPSLSVEDSHILWWHYHRIYDNRYKIRIETTEALLINLLKNICASFVDTQGHFKLKIDNIENFIKSNFICIDSKYSIGYFPYAIDYNKASEVIRFIRFLDEKNFFDPISKSKLNLESIEIQLWIETVFLDAPGFGPSNIETFFTRKSYRGRNLKRFTDIEKILPPEFHEQIQIQASRFPDLYKRSKENVTVDTDAYRIKRTCIHPNKTECI